MINVKTNCLKKITFIQLLKLLCCLLSLFVTNTIKSQVKTYSIEKRLYTYADGLPARHVNCGVQDKYGFLWFGTKNGLCRFDGKKFQTFNQISHGLRGREITELYLDNNNGVVMIYNQKGAKNKDTLLHIDVMDINTLKVTPFASYYPNAPFKEEQIHSVKKSFTNEGIYFYPKPFYTVFFESKISINSWLLNKNLNFIKKENTVIKTGKFISDKTGRKLVISPYSASVDITKESLLIFNDSTIVLYPYNWTHFVYRNKNGYTLCQNDIVEKKQYFQVSFDGSYKKLDSLTKTYYPYLYPCNFIYNQHAFSETAVYINENDILKISNCNKTIEKTEEKIMRSSVISAFKDYLNNFWFCTNEGIIKVNFKKINFKNDFAQTQFKPIANLSTRGIYASKELLMGSLFDFFAVKNKNNTEQLNLKENFAIKKVNNDFWLGSFRLHKYNSVTNEVEYKIESNNQEIWSIEELNNNQLLLGCTSGLSIYTISTNSISKVISTKFTLPKLVYRIKKISHNQLLVIANNGIYEINAQGQIINCYLDTEKGNLPFDAINDAFLDKDSLFWIATANDGLFSWNKKKNKFEQFGSENGFLSNTMYRIEEDDYQKLWISTDFGLAKFNKESKNAKIYTEKDGITHNEFNRSSSFKAEDGSLYFGGLNGITSFNPKVFLEDDIQKNYPFLIDKVSEYNFNLNKEEDQTIIYKKSNKLNLNENHNVNIVVKLLDFEDENNLYAFQIEGYNSEWIYQKDEIIKINNLPYGNYILNVKAQCVDGRWNKTQICIPIFVTKPFYKTWWFIFGSIILVILAIILVINYRTWIIKKRNDKLETIIAYKTSELKISLSEQIALMQEVHHRVKNNLQSVSAIIQMQIQATKNESNQAVLKDTYRRINSMTMVHEMLLNKEKIEFINVNVYIHEMVVKLNELFLDEFSPIEIKLKIEPVKFDINHCVALGMITSEIISNAIKYAFIDTENPVITITLNYIKDEKMIYYCISDNGIGFNLNKKSLGIGMRLLDIFTRQLEGEYELKNNQGTSYTFKIPFKKNE